MNIFLSRPTKVGADYEAAYQQFEKFLNGQGFALKRLGGGNFSKKAPLRAVIDLINGCSGAIILGYPQLEFSHEARRSAEVQNKVSYALPTPWNQIEGALAYASHKPILVVAHPGISGGVFDHGITGEGVLHLDLAQATWFEKPEFQQPFAEWLGEVRDGSAAQARS